MVNKLARTLLLLTALVALAHTQTTETTDPLSQIECKKCKCYELKCSRLENPDATCQNKYRDTCDNSEDISEGDFCNIKCDCCLETKCYTWSTYPCIMFRTYEFSNIVYFILITVNMFILWRLYKSMFSRERERMPDQTDDEGENLNKNLKKTGTYTVKYAGKLTIKKIDKEANFSNEDHRRIYDDFFTEVKKLGSGVGCSNIVVLTILIILYSILNLFHAINIFLLGNKPLTYIYVAWIQHFLLITFWGIVIYAFKKGKLYIAEVRKLIKDFQTKKGVRIVLHEKGQRMDFAFSK